MIPYLPKQFSSRAIFIYLATLAVVTIIFFRHAMKLEFIVMGVVWVLLFFMLSSRYTFRWLALDEGRYVRKLFFTALVLRLIWITFSFFYYLAKTGVPFEFGSSDALAYHDAAVWFNDMGWTVTMDYQNSRSIGDRGYPIYLTVLYSIFGPRVYLVRVIKCLLSSWMCVMVYRMAKRSLGEEVGRMAGIFCCLMPNLIIHCGMHLKETEMIFLTVASLATADKMLHKSQLKAWDVVLEALLVVSLFFFRSGGKSSFKIIKDRKDLLHYILGSHIVHLALFLVRTLPEVIELGHLPGYLILQLLDKLLGLVFFLFILILTCGILIFKSR